MDIKRNMKDTMLDVVFGEHGFKRTGFKGKKSERCYYFAIRNGKTVFTTGQALMLFFHRIVKVGRK